MGDPRRPQVAHSSGSVPVRAGMPTTTSLGIRYVNMAIVFETGYRVLCRFDRQGGRGGRKRFSGLGIQMPVFHDEFGEWAEKWRALDGQTIRTVSRIS